MEASVITERVRALSGITRKELALLADVSPSTIGRIERQEMDPTWSTMQKILGATGYELSGSSVVSRGDMSAIRAASTVLAPILDTVGALTAHVPEEAESRDSEGPAPVSVPRTGAVGSDEWIDRWKRARWLGRAAGVDGLVAVAVTAGNAGKVARRGTARYPVELAGGWRSLVDRLTGAEVDYAVSGFVAAWDDRSEASSGTPLVYVNDPRDAALRLDLERARPGQGILLLEAGDGELDEAEDDGGIRFMPRSRGVLDAFAGLGRDPDNAEEWLRSRWEDAS